MEFGGINYLAVIAATVAGFIFGSVWYGVLAKQWMQAAGVSEEQAKPSVGPMINAFICQLITAWMLAGVIGHLGDGQVTLKNGIISAAFIWFGFVLTTQLVNHRFQGKPWSLSLIDCGHWLGVFVAQGAVIGLMGVSS